MPHDNDKLSLEDKINELVRILYNYYNLTQIGDNAKRASLLINAVKNQKNRIPAVIGICGGCAGRMSIPVLSILLRNKIICPNQSCNEEHPSYDTITYHSHSL